MENEYTKFHCVRIVVRERAYSVILLCWKKSARRTKAILKKSRFFPSFMPHILQKLTETTKLHTKIRSSMALQVTHLKRFVETDCLLHYLARVCWRGLGPLWHLKVPLVYFIKCKNNVSNLLNLLLRFPYLHWLKKVTG